MCPDRTLVKSWLHTYNILPLLPDLAARIVGAYGAVINIDFSSSDSKQLLPKRKTKKSVAAPSKPAAASAAVNQAVRQLRHKGKFWSGCRSVVAAARAGRKRTWGAATGLNDMPLLPALFAKAEGASAKLQLLQVCLRPHPFYSILRGACKWLDPLSPKTCKP